MSHGQIVQDPFSLSTLSCSGDNFQHMHREHSFALTASFSSMLMATPVCKAKCRTAENLARL